MILIAVLGSLHASFAQQVVSSQGNSYESPQLSVDYTVGETVIPTLQGLTQGFHQTYWSFVSIDETTSDVKVSVYPNPFVDELIVTVPEINGIRYELVDASGKVVAADQLKNEITLIPTGAFAKGSYSLVLTGENEINVFKLIKNH